MIKKIFFPFLIFLLLAQVPAWASTCSFCAEELQEERSVNLWNHYYCETDDQKILNQMRLEHHRLDEHPDLEYRKYVQNCNGVSAFPLEKEDYIKSQKFSIRSHTYNYLYEISERGISLTLPALQWMKEYYQDPLSNLKSAYEIRTTPVQWIEQYKTKTGSF